MNRVFIRETGYIVDPSTGIQNITLATTTIQAITCKHGKSFYISNNTTGTLYIGPTAASVYWPIYEQQKEGPYIAPTSNNIIYAKGTTCTSTDPEITLMYVRF